MTVRSLEELSDITVTFSIATLDAWGHRSVLVVHYGLYPLGSAGKR